MRIEQKISPRQMVSVCVAVCVAVLFHAAMIPAAVAATDDAGGEAAARPNVLFIAVDDLNDWIGCLEGHPQAQTPNFDRLAQRGVLFVNAHSNVGVCSPSRTSLMTGKQPFHTGVFTNGETLFDLNGQYRTLPEHFTACGYHTLGAGKLFHGSGGRYAQFFDEYGPGSGNQGGPFTRDEINTLNQNPTHTVDRGPGKLKAVLPMNGMPDDRRSKGARNNSFDWGPVDVTDDEMPDGRVAVWAVKQLQRDFDKPFFLGVGFYRPHQPLFAPRRYHEMFPPEQTLAPETRADDLADLGWYARQLAIQPLTGGRHSTVIKHDQWRNAASCYLACVRFVDELIGRVLDALDESPYSDNTMIVLWSDHGYHLGEKEHWGKFTTWSEATRVPLIIVPPQSMSPDGFRPGTKSSQAVSLIDLYPTLIEMCGMQPPHELDGCSLRPLLSDPQAQSDRPAVVTVGRGTYSIFSQTHHYILYFDGSEELYDLVADPNEWRNLADDHSMAQVKDQLAAAVPADEHVARYARMGKWKAVLYVDDARPAELYMAGPITVSGGGVGETSSIANYPKILDQIRSRLQDSNSTAKRVTIPSRDP